ncbi:hypothetical protein CYFUS_001348 [Cystobacter fuscus]|uniref:Lipoprotein n=1 Tax=Cystobacter fuscus TaxID=43 RepID=A0A250IW18_9BACT|nr:hypothetical protein [Cystobacter fuscus]ATB35934.1 hypothetical protein CYFUS_001348 [Cystobacter fuscus]
MRRLLLLALVALGTAACDQSGSSGTLTPVDVQQPPDDDLHGNGGVVPLPDPEQQDGRVGRSARRLTVDQLGASIQTALGQPWSKLSSRAASLGRADYALVNAESTEANLVFAKFLDDGAREVCVARASADLKLTVAKDRVLARTLPEGTVGDLRKLTDAQVRELLVYLSTRFWGSPLHDEELTRWAGLFTQAAIRAETIKKRDQAIAVLCIAMMTDSRFLTY